MGTKNTKHKDGRARVAPASVYLDDEELAAVMREASKELRTKDKTIRWCVRKALGLGEAK